MSSFSNDIENQLLLLLFNNTDIANIGDAAGLQNSAAAGDFFIALHTADPGETGKQNASEAAYTSYARVAVARTAGGWTVAGNQVSNTALISFPAATGGSETETHFSIGKQSAGATDIILKGNLGSSVQGPFTAATDDNITIPGHTLIVDDRVAFYPAYGSTLPTGITEGVLYWVKTSAANVITISTTQGGATLDITAVGDGVAYRAATLAVSVGITPQFAAGVLVATLD